MTRDVWTRRCGCHGEWAFWRRDLSHPDQGYWICSVTKEKL